MSNYNATQSGIYVPESTHKPVGVQCGFCPEIIFKHKEAGGRLFLHKGEKPICARCRILKGSKYAGRIRKDRKKYEQDLAEQKKIEENKEVERVAKIAVESQKRAEKIDPSKKSKTDRKKFNL
jgi:hypothetical protein